MFDMNLFAHNDAYIKTSILNINPFRALAENNVYEDENLSEAFYSYVNNAIDLVEEYKKYLSNIKILKLDSDIEKEIMLKSSERFSFMSVQLDRPLCVISNYLFDNPSNLRDKLEDKNYEFSKGLNSTLYTLKERLETLSDVIIKPNGLDSNFFYSHIRRLAGDDLIDSIKTMIKSIKSNKEELEDIIENTHNILNSLKDNFKMYLTEYDAYVIVYYCVNIDMQIQAIENSLNELTIVTDICNNRMIMIERGVDD